MQDTEAIA